MATPYTLDLTATQVNAAVNAAHDSGDPVTAGSSKLVQSGAVYDEVVRQIRALTGWARYVDSQYTSGSPLSTGSTKTQLNINGLGTNTETSYLPTGVASLWSTAANKITPAAEGDAYDVRLDFTAIPHSVSDVAEVIFEVNGAPLAHRTVTFAKGGATSFSIGLPMAVGSDFLTHGCSIQFDTSYDIDIYDISLFIKRDFTALT